MERLVRQWQHLYQTGKVCLVLAPRDDDDCLESVLLDDLGSIRPLLVELPSDQPWIPSKVSQQGMVHAYDDHVEWVFEQLDVDFDLSRIRWVPLVFTNRPVGLILFELNYPVPMERLKEVLQETTVLAGTLLGLFLEAQSRLQGAEHLLEGLLTSSVEPVLKEAGMPLFDVLAEVAAGFAHELNNPLSVISGRAQLLSSGSADETSQQALQQIQENAQEASSMVEGLLAFAHPPALRRDHVSLAQVLDEAVQLAQQKLGAEHLDTHMNITYTAEVYVDSAQMASAIANIIVNAFESYSSLSEHVDIDCHGDPDHKRVRISVQDHGCGMDTDTLHKATYPFFSAKPAGRKRGMGLAYAARVIQLHGGQLELSSEVDRGTTVHIALRIS
jgi:signal transduction histidine kinase